MSNPYSNDESIYSDLYRIKGEILDSTFLAAKLLGKIQKLKTTGMKSHLAEANFNMYVINMYIKLRPFLYMTKVQEDKKIKKASDEMMEYMDSMIIDDTAPDYKKMKDYFLTMMIILKKINVYGVGYVKGDPTTAWQQGME